MNSVRDEIVKKLLATNFPEGCDLSDIGNELGIIIAKYIDKNKNGHEIESLIAGIKHGVSLIDGTH